MVFHSSSVSFIVYDTFKPKKCVGLRSAISRLKIIHCFAISSSQGVQTLKDDIGFGNGSEQLHASMCQRCWRQRVRLNFHEKLEGQK